MSPEDSPRSLGGYGARLLLNFCFFTHPSLSPSPRLLFTSLLPIPSSVPHHMSCAKALLPIPSSFSCSSFTQHVLPLCPSSTVIGGGSTVTKNAYMEWRHLFLKFPRPVSYPRGGALQMQGNELLSHWGRVETTSLSRCRVGPAWTRTPDSNFGTKNAQKNKVKKAGTKLTLQKQKGKKCKIKGLSSCLW